MINRDNYFAMQRYLNYRLEVEQLAQSSVRLEESWLRHLLEWAQEKPFSAAPKIKPAFPAYMLNARRDGKAKPLSKIYLDKVIGAARRLFLWLSLHENGYRSLTQVYLDTLRTPRLDEVPTTHEAVTLEEIRAIAQAQTCNLGERRVKAAAVFLFLSGIRVGAFTSLRLENVNLQERAVNQWPSTGVRTKNSKHATTYLLDIPDLFALIQDWDGFLRARLPLDALWFAAIHPKTRQLDTSIAEPGEHRHAKLRRDLKAWLGRVGLPYHSPHKFRHGHAVYGISQAKDVADLKAISLNLMHSNLSITDGIYAILSNDAVQARIAGLGTKENTSAESLAEMLRTIADELDSSQK